MCLAGPTYYYPPVPNLPGTNRELMRLLRLCLTGVACLTSVVVLATCTTATDPTPIASISLQPALDSLEVGEIKNQWLVTAVDASGLALSGRTFTWESSNLAVATVDASTGAVTGVSSSGNGIANITVRAEGKFAVSAMKVLIPIVSIVATPDSFDVPLTTTRTIGVQLVGPNGVAITNRLITWASSSPGVAVVSATGVVTPVSVGTTTITIRAGTKTATVRARVVGEPVTSVRITPQQSVHIVRLGQTKQLGAECLNAAQQVVTGRPITWNSSNPIVATVSGSGLVSGNAVGSASITANCDGTANATVTAQVTPVPVSSVTITPQSVSLSLNQPGPLPQQQLLATAKDSAGNTLSLQGRQVQWLSNNIPVADVSAVGVVTGRTIGSAQITVTVDGVSSAPVPVDVQAFFSVYSAFDTARRRQNAVGLR